MGQSSGWLISRNSSTARRAATACSDWTRTTMPGDTGVAHDGTGFGLFSMSTRHIRHEPATGSPGW